jgi:hypothetical protein
MSRLTEEWDRFESLEEEYQEYALYHEGFDSIDDVLYNPFMDEETKEYVIKDLYSIGYHAWHEDNQLGVDFQG